MAKTFTTFVQLQKMIEPLIEKAVKNAAIIITDKLTETIKEQYYQDPEFYPNVYQRTETFMKSAAYNMLSGNSAEIFIDGDGMHYKNGFDPWQVIEWASMSMHGAEYYQTTTTDFWTAFMEWADGNVINILEQELRKVGLNVVKK